ncbi:hypothetical protein H0H93_010951 [Arthromyces matolae]|nr:hypothetical protein H0H93_010951 [Arthromyces matolae]
MPSATPRVLIVGAGPSGLVCALSLRRNGVAVRIIDKATEPRVGQRGAGIMVPLNTLTPLLILTKIQPRSIELLHNFGCADELLRRGRAPPLARRYHSSDCTPGAIEEFNISPGIEPNPSYPHTNIVLLGQSHVEEILRDALSKLDIEVEAGTEAVSFEETSTAVNVHLVRHGLKRGAHSMYEDASYDWMIGADGARGVVRKLSGFSFLGETRTIENYVVGDVFVEGISEKKPLEYWHMRGDANSTFVSLRPTETSDLFSFIISGNNINHNQLSSNEEALRNCLAETMDLGSSLKFKNFAWVNRYIPNIRMTQTLQTTRVLLVGDSAHVHSFTGGQGINTGMQDSYNLGWKLSLVQRGLSPLSLLKTYSEERIPIIREMLDRTTKILQHTFSEQPTEPWNRDNELLQLGINHRWSSLVLDERKVAEDAEFSEYDFDDEEKESSTVDPIDAYGGNIHGVLRAGDRAPDAPDLLELSRSSQSTRLFNIFTPSHHTVLIFSPALSQLPDIVQLLKRLPSSVIQSVLLRRRQEVPMLCNHEGVTSIIEDQNGHAHNAYTVDDQYAVVVVRPDGVVGAILHGMTGLEALVTTLLTPIMDAASVLSDDDYDVISNPGLGSSTTDFGSSPAQIVHEPPPSQLACDTFDSVTWSAHDIQAYVRKALGNTFPTLPSIETTKRVHALRLRQAKLSLPSVYLIVGVHSDEQLQSHGCITAFPYIERCEIVRHCRWVDEIIIDAPYVLNQEFIEKHKIDFVSFEEGTSVDPSCDKARLKGYDAMKDSST